MPAFRTEKASFSLGIPIFAVETSDSSPEGELPNRNPSLPKWNGEL